MMSKQKSKTKTMEGTQLNPSLDFVKYYNIVVAIDFGSTYCGYAYSTRLRPHDIILNKNWGSEFATQTYKTPTAVLVDKSKKFVAFGYAARSMYKLEKSARYFYDQNFKMLLYNKKRSLDSTIEVTSREGNQTMSLLSLIAMSIKYLYGHMKEELETAYNGFHESAVRVVLAVPAIWSDSAKNFMRRAAFEAGIESERLILALEPEAASYYCRILTPNELHSTRYVDLSLPNGSRYVVIDCGGGTVDFTVHEVIDDSNVREIHCANGGPWGGQNVNTQFETLLTELLGENIIIKYKENNPLDWFEIQQSFELIKRTHKRETEISIPLPYSLIKAYQGHGLRRKKLEKHINKRKQDGFKFKEGRLVLSSEIMKDLFTSSIDRIVDHIHKLWEDYEIRKVRHVFMVGGYSDCDFLYRKIVNTFSYLSPYDQNIQVLRPNQAGVSVVKGAVLFGHQPTHIKSRKSRLTYGRDVMCRFKPRVHSLRHKRIVDGEEQCADLFQIWVRKNESIEVGEKRIFKVLPHSQQATHFRASIYAVDSEYVTYVTDPGVFRLASLEIPIPDTQLPHNEREIIHEVYFGGTELYVKIQDDSTPWGATQFTRIDFA